MRALLQRVTRADVQVDGRSVGRIGAGLVVFLGVGHDDSEPVAEVLARKVAGSRILRDPSGRADRSVLETEGAVLVVSQFTLYADTRRGRRPGFTGAAEPVLAERCYRRFVDALEHLGLTVATGRFGAEMTVEVINDGPFTIWLDTAEASPSMADPRSPGRAT